MKLLRTWLPPTALAVGQLLLWPGLPLLRGTPPDRFPLVAGLVAIGLTALALGVRRRAPVPVLAVVLAAQTLGRLVAPPDALAVLSIAELVALFSVAVRSPGRVTRLALAGAAGWVALINLPRFGPGPAWTGEVVLAVLGYLLIAGLGRSRRHWLAGRSAAANRLVAAEGELRRAAEAERHRLARELHDVSAHHLTAIVVTVGAAERLAARRPGLMTEAVAFAARTGRETLTALRRLVAVMGASDRDENRPLAVRIEELADGFRRLGQPVRLDLRAADLPPSLAEPGYGIVREALTNVLRHAFGADVLVRLVARDGAVEITVTDDGGRGPAASTLGAGRGIAGMRERAVGVGGTLTAGPAERGWQVRARLPREVAPTARRRPAGRSVLTATLMATAVVFPVAGALVMAETDPSMSWLRNPVTFALVSLLCVVRAAPLGWRCTRPWTALAGVTGSIPLWPLAAWLAGLPPEVLFVLFFSIAADLAAVWAVAAYAGRAGWSWLAAPVTATLLAAGLVGTAAVDGSLAGESVHVPVTGFMVGFVAALLLVPMLLAWGAGALLRHRRSAVLTREDDALAAAMTGAIDAARAERVRIAVGLRAAVLERAGRLVAAADAGRVDEILVEARATLAAMRELLDDLRADGGADPGGPQPGAAGIAALCAARRAAGREVAFEGPADLSTLPAGLDTSAYRVVEAALGAGRGPVRVSVTLSPEELVITASAGVIGMDPVALAGIRARVEALGGGLRLPAGALEVRLPLPAGAPARPADAGPPPDGSPALAAVPAGTVPADAVPGDAVPGGTVRGERS